MIYCTSYAFASEVKQLININKNGLCEYPKVSGIKYSKKKRTNKVFSKSEIEKLRRNKSNNNLINAFLFTCATGTKLSIIRKLKWGEIKNNKHNYYIQFKSKNKCIKSKLPLALPLTFCIIRAHCPIRVWIFSRDLTAFRVVAEVTDSSLLISLLLAC